jgi:hypothetical protein
MTSLFFIIYNFSIMFTTKNLVHDIKDVPVTWVFEHYAELKEKLTGQDIKIKSLFNDKDRTPSMCVYIDKTKEVYRFKDFSTGKGGCHIELVKLLFDFNYHQACHKILEDYNDFILHNNGGYDLQQFKQHRKYHVDNYVQREWNSRDGYFWTQFNISSRLLDKYNVRPLDQYTMSKVGEDGTEIKLMIKGLYIYGYFREDGTLYKIYQPKTQDKKFLKVASYTQGVEQLQGKRWLLITSSLKDLLSVRSLKLDLDLVAPDSENSLIPKEQMDEWLKQYEKVLVLFDYDDPGIEAMKKYKEKYPQVELVVLPMSKDVSDSIKDHGASEVRQRLVPLINKKISLGVVVEH